VWTATGQVQQIEDEVEVRVLQVLGVRRQRRPQRLQDLCRVPERLEEDRPQALEAPRLGLGEMSGDRGQAGEKERVVADRVEDLDDLLGQGDVFGQRRGVVDADEDPVEADRAGDVGEGAEVTLEDRVVDVCARVGS
jgi:hypothetical protein